MAGQEKEAGREYVTLWMKENKQGTKKRKKWRL
jgi:hypothetical protein